MKRKALLCLLVVVLAAALFAGGGQSASNPSTPAGASIVTAPGTFPVVNTPITLKVFAGGSASIENFETNTFTKFYEQKSGVKLEWTIAPPASLTELRRLSLASGDLPDFYMNAGFSRDDEVLYGGEKVLVPLNNLIDTYGFWIKDLFKEIPESRSLITTPDGNIYGLPEVQDSIHALYPNKLYINSEWLEKLNLKVPATTDEYYEVLKAFKTRDPNGNGRADEIPLICESPPPPGFSGLFNYFVNSFVQMDGDGFYVTRDNKVDIAYNKPEFRQALAYLNKLVSEGLLDPSSFSISNAELRQIAENPNYQIVGSTVQLAPSTFYSMASERQKKFDAIAPLRGPNGVRLASYNSAAQVYAGRLNITNKCRYPEVVIRWVDWFFEQEGLMSMRIGREGIE
jgi:putative aldouronate transport system substrate-binding protein